MKRKIGEVVAKYLQKKGELHNLLDFNRIRLLCSGSSVILALISQQQSGGKKMKKSVFRLKEKRGTLRLSAFLLAVSMLLCSCAKEPLPPDPRVEKYLTEVQPYLEQYAKPIDWKQGLSDSDFGEAKNARVFLAGETYFQDKNYQAKKMLLSYLHQNCGVNYLLLEESIGAGILAEEYLKTGDEELLHFMMRAKKEQHGNTKEDAEFWKWLYEYNLEQPEQKKIHVIGLDIESNWEGEAVAARLLLKEGAQAPYGLHQWWGDFTSDDLKAISRGFSELSRLISQYPDQMQPLFAENFNLLLRLMGNIDICYQYRNGKQMGKTPAQINNIRERAIANNFSYFFDQLPQDAKYFGQFLDVRSFQSVFEQSESGEKTQRFATILTEEILSEEEVCSILCVSAEGKGEKAEFVNPQYSWLPVELFRSCVGQDTFLALDGKDSPFHSGEEELRLTDYVQKMIFLTDSKETQPYR